MEARTDERTPTSAKAFEIVDDKHSISCLQYGGTTPKLVFTHGAGGDHTSEAMINFASGFSTLSPMVSFKGSMNLKSRVKAFETLLGDDSCRGAATLGGRSMGARAAVMAATPHTEMLILVSYPLKTEKGDVRDQILLDLRGEIDVLFISGDKDSMCNIQELNAVRASMKAKTWLAVVREADHGMNVKPKRGTKAVGEETGRLAAEWAIERDAASSECVISFGEEGVERTGWTAGAGKKKTGKGKVEASQAEPTKGRKEVAAGKVEAGKRKLTDVDSTVVRRSSRLKMH